MVENNKDTVSVSGLVEDYGRLVSSICRRMIRDEETARDAAQEAWLEIIKNVPSFRGESKLSTWIYTVTYRAVMRYAVKEKVYTSRYVRDCFHQEEIKVPCSQDLDKMIWVKQMCDKCLTGVLYCLNPESRMAYILRDIARLSYEEIADVLEHSSMSVRQIISRSRRKLRNFLKDECVLHNTRGKCSCRMRRWVKEVDLVHEYQELRQSIGEVNVFRESEEILSRVNYWRQFLDLD